MVELRTICEDNNLTYYLSPQTASYAYLCGGFTDKYENPRFLMPYDSAVKLKEYVDSGKLKDRTIESIDNNPRFTRFGMDYVDDSTTFINFKRGTDYRFHGLRIEIDVLRPMPVDKHLERQELMLECAGYSKHLSLRHPFVNAVFKTVSGPALKLGAAKSLNKKIHKRCEGAQADDFYYTFRALGTIVVPGELLKEVTTVKFEGEDFVVPARTEEFLDCQYNGSWKTLDEKVAPEFKPHIFYDNCPYKEMLEFLDKHNSNLYRFFEHQEERNLGRDDILRINEDKTNNWRIAQRSGARLELFLRLNENIDHIRELFAASKYSELEEIFAEYDKEAHRYLKWDMSLCPSKELMDIECELLRARGENENADKLQKLAPEAHYSNPLAVTNEA